MSIEMDLDENILAVCQLCGRFLTNFTYNIILGSFQHKEKISFYAV